MSSIKGRIWRFGPRAGETLSFNKKTFIITPPAPSLCILSKSLSSSNLIDGNELHFNTSGVVSAPFVLANTAWWNESVPGPDSVLIRGSSDEPLTGTRVRDDNNNWWLELQTESSTDGESAFPPDYIVLRLNTSCGLNREIEKSQCCPCYNVIPMQIPSLRSSRGIRRDTKPIVYWRVATLQVIYSLCKHKPKTFPWDRPYCTHPYVQSHKHS